MQKIKVVQSGLRSFTLKELNTRAVWELTNGGKDNQQDSPSVASHFQSLLVLACPELTSEVLLDLYPSEIEELWLAFKEVNSAFLGVVERTGLLETLLESVKPMLRAEMQKALRAIENSSTGPSVSSLPPGTVQ